MISVSNIDMDSHVVQKLLPGAYSNGFDYVEIQGHKRHPTSHNDHMPRNTSLHVSRGTKRTTSVHRETRQLLIWCALITEGFDRGDLIS